MNVAMRDGLSSGRAVLEQSGKSFRVKVRLQDCSYVLGCLEKLNPFFRSQE
jgi:hypothetical protein